MKKVMHLTSVHPRHDMRIFAKQCKSLAANGYDVTLVVADGQGTQNVDNVDIVDVGVLPGRRNRILKTTRKILKIAARSNAKICHIHDPELIPVGLRLRSLGKTVIFDSHEDAPKQLLVKPYMGPLRLKFLKFGLSMFEYAMCRFFDGIIAATPTIRDKFLRINPNTIDINNFPLLNELNSAGSWDNKRAEVCYIGWITALRGIREVISALDQVKSPVRLNLVGKFSEAQLEVEAMAMPGWDRVNQLGFLGRDEVRAVLGRSMAGLVTFHPMQSHIDAQPNKMFEYMSAGVPVIASNFPLWREIIEGNKCGICVDPLDSAAIAKAIDRLVQDTENAKIMGSNGEEAVARLYNWPMEEAKLLDFYACLA